MYLLFILSRICFSVSSETKYSINPVSAHVINEFEKKLELFDRKKNYSLQKILITVSGADKALIDRHYFDKIITLEELFTPQAWG